MKENSIIKSDNPMRDIQNELSMFEQTSYCESYLASKFHNIDIEQIKHQAKIASSSFRQAKEYYDAGTKVSISTKPLLFSYALNNYSKGLCHLLSIDKDILSGFNAHGFKMNSTKSILDASLTLKNKGAVVSLQKVVTEVILPTQKSIPLTTILSNIPALDNVINKSASLVSNIAKYSNGDYTIHLFDKASIPSFPNKILNLHGTVYKEAYTGEYIWKITLSLGSRRKISELPGISMPLSEYIVVPTMIGDSEVILQPMIASYLIMMAYSMYVRYHAEMWEDLIDPKISSLYRMIFQSIENSIDTFITDLHRLLLGKHIIKRQFDDSDVQRCIDNNITSITKKIEKELKDLAIQRNRGLF